MSPTPVPGVGLVVVAAGRGERLGAGRPKALVEVAGRPLLAWALEGAAAAGLSDVVVVAPTDALDEVRAPRAGCGGGARAASTRQASVAAGLAALPPGELVLVHDAARAFVPPPVFAAVVAALRAGEQAVVPARPARRHAAAPRGRPGRPVPGRGRPDPAGLPSATCSSGRTRAATAQATDDAGLVERLGIHVHVVPGSEEGFKVTRPLDVLLAEALVRSRSAP